MDVFRIFGRIAVNNSEANQAIDSTVGKAGKAADMMGKAVVGMGKVIAASAAAAVTAIGAVSAGIAVLTKEAVGDYAEYEQLVGGVETLFKESSDKVVRYANDAYKTAGLSANQYMQTVTSFSASLLQSLGNDTEMAAEKANLAITDMSDNANKMGTDMQSIQNAYQGFAKQNYTMLDNLKLGYGGTKEEMQRLLDKANELNAQQGIHTDYQIQNYADIVDAIHVVQTEMDITGTTAKEAASTIQGSIGMMKGAWTNFLTGMADPKQDFDALVGNLVESIGIVGENLVPRILMAVPRVVAGLSQAAQMIIPQIPALFEQLLPKINASATSLFQAIIGGIENIFPMILDSVPKIISVIQSIMSAISPYIPSLFEQLLPSLLEAATTVMGMLFENLSTVLAKLLPSLFGSEIGSSLANAFSLLFDLIQSLLPLVESILMDALVPLITAVLPYLVEVINQLVPIIQQMIPILIEIVLTILPVVLDLLDALLPLVFTVLSLLPTLLDLISSLVPVLAMVLDIAVFSLKMFTTLADFIFNIYVGIVKFIIGWLAFSIEEVVKMITGFWESVKVIFDTIVEFVKTLLSNVFGLIMNEFSAFGQLFTGDINGFIEGIRNAYKEFFNFILSFFGTNVDELLSKANGFISKMNDKIKTALVNAKSLFKDGLNAIKDAFKAPINGILAMVNKLVDALNALSFKIPDWIPEVGGKEFKMNLSKVPMLANGGVLEKGQMGFLEGTGAEAVVPLDQNRKWISAVSNEMLSQGIGGDNETLEVLKEILDMLKMQPDTIVDAIANGLSFRLNEREFGRMVKAVN